MSGKYRMGAKWVLLSELMGQDEESNHETAIWEIETAVEGLVVSTNGRSRTKVPQKAMEANPDVVMLSFLDVKRYLRKKGITLIHQKEHTVLPYVVKVAGTKTIYAPEMVWTLVQALWAGEMMARAHSALRAFETLGGVRAPQHEPGTTGAAMAEKKLADNLRGAQVDATAMVNEYGVQGTMVALAAVCRARGSMGQRIADQLARFLALAGEVDKEWGA